MRVSVNVKAGAKTERMEKTGEREFAVWVRSPTREGRANRAAMTLVAAHFDVAPSRVSLISGHTHHRKIMKVDA